MSGFFHLPSARP